MSVTTLYLYLPRKRLVPISMSMAESATISKSVSESISVSVHTCTNEQIHQHNQMLPTTNEQIADSEPSCCSPGTEGFAWHGWPC